MSAEMFELLLGLKKQGYRFEITSQPGNYCVVYPLSKLVEVSKYTYALLDAGLKAPYLRGPQDPAAFI